MANFNNKVTYAIDINMRTHTLSWNVDFDVINKAREMRTFVKNYYQPYFQVKIDIINDNYEDIDIRVYFLYPTTKYISTQLTISTNELPKNIHQSYSNNYGFEYSHNENRIHKTDYSKIIANKWHYLEKLDKSNIPKINNTTDIEYIAFLLKFEFNILDLDNMSTENGPSFVNINKFYNADLFSDIVVKACDGTIFKAHKLVLASASPVFKAHFDHGTKECTTNTIESPFEPEVIEAVLAYLYNNFPTIDKIPQKILAAADFYQLNELKDLCEQELNTKITAENVIEILEFAVLHNAESLKQKALEFIKLEQSDAFTKTESWAQFESISTLKMLIEFLKFSKDVIIVNHNIEKL